MRILEIFSLIGGSIIGLGFTFAVGVIIYVIVLESFRKIFGIKGTEKPHNRAAESIRRMRITSERFSRDINFVIAEISKREEILASQEKKVKLLAEEEKKLRNKVEKLRKTPVGAMEYFKDVIVSSDRKRFRRDLVMLGCGMILNAVINNTFGLTSLLDNFIKGLFGS